jgi:hypothetical protein
MVEWNEVEHHTFLNLALDGGELLASLPRALNPENYRAALNKLILNEDLIIF